MNHVDYDYTVLPTSEESAAYSELMDEIIHSFGGKISPCEFIVTVDYSALNYTATYRIRQIETAVRIIARSRAGNCPLTWRVTLKPSVAAEARWKRDFRYSTLSDYIRSA